MDPNYSPNPQYYPPPATMPTSTMAIVSLISGILGFTLFPFIGSIIAIITVPRTARPECARRRNDPITRFRFTRTRR